MKELNIERRTADAHLGYLRTIMIMARDKWGILDSIPSFDIKRGSTKQRYWFYDFATEDMILHHFDTYKNPNHRDKTPVARETGDLFRFAVDTGLRAAEWEQLRWMDVDLKGRVITLDPKSGLIIKHDRYRQVPMTDRVFNLLDKRYAKAKRTFRSDTLNKKQIWPLKYDQYHQQLLTMRVNLFAEHEQKKVLWHVCRHTFITRLFQAGVDSPTVQQLAGHCDIRTTELYAQTNMMRMQSAVAKLNYLRLEDPLLTQPKNENLRRMAGFDDVMKWSELSGRLETALREKVMRQLFSL